MSESFVVSGAAAQDATLSGGKAAALARLADLWPVPEFFVIIAQSFTESGVKAAARDAIGAALDRLGAGPFAVRSSGVEEDGAAAAHAGQFDTELNIAPAGVIDAAHRIWRSGFSERLATYRRAQGLSDAPQPPAVIVQIMVDARAAGVAFSACPVSGDRDVVVVSAVRGLADRLVAGEADGDSYRLGAGAITLEQSLIGESPVLNDSDRRQVFDLARRVEARCGEPQDIEWAFDHERLLLLQARPITTLGAAEELIVWDNSNIVESYPGLVSTLTYSFASYVYAHVYREFSRLMGVSARAVSAHNEVFERLLGRIDGRVYYNLLNWYRALALFPGFQANRRFMEQMMGVAEALPAETASRIAPPATNGFVKVVDSLRAARVALGLAWHACALPRTIERFYPRLNEALAKPNAAIDAMTPRQLAAEYRQLEDRLLARWDAPLINDFLCMIAFGASRKAMASWAGDSGLALHADMMIGQGDIVSAEPAQRIRAMGALVRSDLAVVELLARADRAALQAHPALAEAFGAYVSKFGDRCTQELKLESLSLEEDPSQVLMAIAAAARAPDRGAPAHQDSSARLTSLFASKPLKAVFARRLLFWAKARVRDRENLRFERTRLFGRVRRIMNRIGDHLAADGALAEPRDIFHLTVNEALAAVERGAVADLRALVSKRQGEDAASLARAAPPERFQARGETLPTNNAVNHAEAHDDINARKGTACCAGVIVARVRVIEDPRVEALNAGEILVARHTDPGWIAVFANAAGVIAERGSLLSHSAIVAREMGIPCVVALKGATTWLKTGDVVRLDGGAGRVERVEQA